MTECETESKGDSDSIDDGRGRKRTVTIFGG